MKATNVVKVIPITHIISPILLQCKSGECGGCPNNTGKMLWVPLSFAASSYFSFNFQYNFFDKSAESTSPIRYSMASGFNSLTSTNFSYENPPNKAWAVANNAIDYPTLSPALMKGSDILSFSSIYMLGAGGWLFFRQPNPAIANVHDALCFEYNNDKKLITFRSF